MMKRREFPRCIQSERMKKCTGLELFVATNNGDNVYEFQCERFTTRWINDYQELSNKPGKNCKPQNFNSYIASKSNSSGDSVLFRFVFMAFEMKNVDNILVCMQLDTRDLFIPVIPIITEIHCFVRQEFDQTSFYRLFSAINSTLR